MNPPLAEPPATNGGTPRPTDEELRVGGLDLASDVAAPGARPPLLSVVRPHPDHPEFDCAVWVDVLTLPGTPGAAEFYRELERFRLTTFDGGHALTRVEWSKGWGYTATAAWADPEVIGTVVPASYGEGQWAEGVETLRRLDAHGVFGDAFLDGLLTP